MMLKKEKYNEIRMKNKKKRVKTTTSTTTRRKKLERKIENIAFWCLRYSVT